MQCDVCGNPTRHPMTLTQREDRFVVDCLECAIHVLAPTCAECSCRIIGHPVLWEDEVFCSRRCVAAAGAAVVAAR
ncbi:MAG: hypothetical protein AB7V27_15150 [Candidatus Binatia bacterium]